MMHRVGQALGLFISQITLWSWLPIGTKIEPTKKHSYFITILIILMGIGQIPYLMDSMQSEWIR